MSDALSAIAARSLGDSTSYAVFTDKFDASLLNPMPRSHAREQYGIQDLHFLGFDSWTCHEATFLLDNGLPVSGTLRFIYDASSELMVESKSAKLYLNSFDMCKMGPSEEAAISNYVDQVKQDLEKVLKTDVSVKFFSSKEWLSGNQFNPIQNYINLVGMDGIAPSILESVVFDDYEGKKNHIESIDFGQRVSQAWYTNALRSRCRHTKQKDTGLAAISYNSNKIISPISLLKQIVSLREVNEFHEFCAERLFADIAKHLNPTDPLSIMLLYSRRGSLDINPVRFRGSVNNQITCLKNSEYLPSKVQGQ